MPNKGAPLFLWKLSFRNLLRQRRRSVVCILTIATGVMCLLLFEGFNRGALWEYQERVVHTRVGHFQISKKTDEATLSTDVEDTVFSDYDSLVSDIRSRPEVENIFPRLKVSGLLTNDQRSIPVIAEGIDPSRENEFFDELEYLKGGALEPDQEDGVILGEGVAKALGAEVGSRVTLLANTMRGSINAVDLYVTGLFRSGVKEFDESFIRIHLGSAQALLQTEGVSSLVVGLKRSQYFDKMKNFFRGLSLDRFSWNDFIELDDVYYGNSVRWLKAQFIFIRVVIYLVVIMGILNTVVIMINERTHEIGTLRALGLGRSFVLKQFLREYFLLGLAGSALGIAAALIFAHGVLIGGVPMPPSPGATKGLQVLLRMTFFDATLNMFAAVACSLLACYFPTRLALKKPIVEALRPRL